MPNKHRAPRRPGKKTQTSTATQQPQNALPTQQINMPDSVTGQETMPVSQTNRGTLSHQATALGE